MNRRISQFILSRESRDPHLSIFFYQPIQSVTGSGPQPAVHSLNQRKYIAIFLTDGLDRGIGIFELLPAGVKSYDPAAASSEPKYIGVGIPDDRVNNVAAQCSMGSRSFVLSDVANGISFPLLVFHSNPDQAKTRSTGPQE